MDAAGLHGGRVVVVGGGIVGLSIAHHLVARGYRAVTVLERDRLGEGATAYATGGIRHQFSAPVNVRLSLLAGSFWSQFESRTGRPLDLRRHGYLFLLTDPSTVPSFATSMRMQRELGVDVRMLEPNEIRDVFPAARTDDLTAGTFSAMDGSASPTDAVAGLAHSVRTGGAAIRQGVDFRGVLTDHDGAVRAVRTSAGDVDAERVVLATGPAARETGRRCGIDVPVRPHPRQAFATVANAHLRGGLPLAVDMATGAYLHPEPSGAAVIGGNDRDAAPSDRAAVDWSRIDTLAAALDHRFPGLDLQVTRGWSGLREMTDDDLPIVGPVAQVPGLWVCAGFSGHGFMHAPAIGDQLTRWWLDGSTDIDLRPLRPGRFTEKGRRDPEMAVF